MVSNKKGKSHRYTVKWTEPAKKQLNKLDNSIKDRIVKFFEKDNLLSDPSKAGKSLSNKLAGLHRYRIGDYRAIAEIQNNVLVILVIKVGRRDEVYTNPTIRSQSQIKNFSH